jgi:outer membrane protein OmpA-like peptidoglycan-associated protein
VKFFTGIIFLLLSVSLVRAESFRFKYAAGDKYRILSTVHESVLINREKSHEAEILNRITVDVTGEGENGGKLSCSFQTSEEARGDYNVFSWGKSYESEFFRDSLGRYTIDEKYFMPIVRNVPVFPDRDIRPGDTWEADGEEVHDFSASFSVREPVRFPIKVSYTYLGKEKYKDAEYHALSVSYDVHHRIKFRTNPGRLYPALISGYSRQKIYWDEQRGWPQAYSEEFDFIFELSSGDSVEYRGTAAAEVIEAFTMNKEQMAQDIKQALEEAGLADLGVRQDDLGITLMIENIQFLPDSSILTGAEKEKLDRIGEILQKYPDRDILISGHTALAGTREGRQKISEDRAASVGAYLLAKGVRTKERMVYRGLGADVPIAENSTEAGKSRNRRVEITILEN